MHTILLGNKDIKWDSFVWVIHDKEGSHYEGSFHYSLIVAFVSQIPAFTGPAIKHFLFHFNISCLQ